MIGVTKNTKEVIETINSSSLRLIVFPDEDLEHGAKNFPAASLLIAFLNLDFDTLDHEYWLTCSCFPLDRQKFMRRDGLVPVICKILGDPERCSKERLKKVQCSITDTLKDVLGEEPDRELGEEALNVLGQKLRKLAKEINEIGMQVELRVEPPLPAGYEPSLGHAQIFEEFFTGQFGARRAPYPRHDIVVENINEMRSISVGKKCFDQFELIHIKGIENFFFWLLRENLRTNDFVRIKLCQGYNGGSGRWEKCGKFFLDAGEAKPKKYCSKDCKTGYHNKKSLERKSFADYRQKRRNKMIAMARRLKREGKSIDEIVEKTELSRRKLKDARLFK
jgi:hypothetical protein